MKFKAIECEFEDEAIQCAAAMDWTAILLHGKPVVIRDADADRLAASRISFAYLCDHKGRIVTVPVN